MSEIKKGNHKFYIGEDENNPIAQITYKDQDEQTIVADHTFVSDELRGQGIAGKLFDQLIQYARQENKKIVPVCSYVKIKMERSDEYADLIAK
ncbi:MAG TPA: GNAT family N-acetyltransferase [Pseudogracilibacillus sp.]|nr:GNAT family N-acetyltransferase [Pseudogracilibacillus sp.]